MYIRDLQSRVQFIRQDLPAGHTNQALQDAARWLARKTGIVRTKAYGVVLGGSVFLDIPVFMDATTNEFDVLRVTRVMYLPGLDPRAVSLGVRHQAGDDLPAPSSAHTHEFAVYAYDGNTLVAGASTPVRKGDVLVCDGTKWNRFGIEKYSVAKDLSKERVYKVINNPLDSTGYMSAFLYESKDSLSLRPIPNRDTPVIVECSIVPRKEFDDVDFPPEAEDALVYAARAQVCGTPNKTGGGADLASASRWQDKADGEMTLVRAVAEGGYGDTFMAPPPVFGV